jgi:hypothetical protein
LRRSGAAAGRAAEISDEDTEFPVSLTFRAHSAPLKNKPFEINAISHEISYRKFFCPQKHGVADRD